MWLNQFESIVNDIWIKGFCNGFQIEEWMVEQWGLILVSLTRGSGVGALPLTLTVLGASILVGITTSLILFCSHFHQVIFSHFPCVPFSSLDSRMTCQFFFALCWVPYPIETWLISTTLYHAKKFRIREKQQGFHVITKSKYSLAT